MEHTMSDTTTTPEVLAPAALTKAEVKSKGFDFHAMVVGIREANTGQARVHGTIMWNAALVLGEAKARGLVGAKAGAAGWPTQVAYATAAGYAESTGSLLSTLATAQGHGLKVDSREWTFLVQSGTNGRVSKAVRDAKSGKDLRAGLRPLIAEKAEHGKIAPAKAKAGSKKSKTADEKAADKAAAARLVKPTRKDVEAAIAAMRVAFHSLSDADWKAIRALLVKERDSEDGRRQKLAAKAAREQATPEQVAV